MVKQSSIDQSGCEVMGGHGRVAPGSCSLKEETCPWKLLAEAGPTNSCSEYLVLHPIRGNATMGTVWTEASNRMTRKICQGSCTGWLP